MSSEHAPALRADLLGASLDLLEPHAGELAERFYTLLFNESPELRALFPADMARQRRAFGGTLMMIRKSLEAPGLLSLYFEGLGRRHVDYGVTAAQYPVVGAALIGALAEVLGEAWAARLAYDRAVGAPL